MPHVDIQAVRKTMELVSDPQGGVKEVAVPEACQDTPCLELDEIRGLSRWVLMLEKHFGDPQDVEWVLDQGRHLFIVQSRPLHQMTPLEPPELSPTIDKELLIHEGLIAAPGIAAGPAVLVRSAEDLAGFPKGGVLVAANSSPEYVQVMDRAAAIVTNVGSTIGHMASVAREFRVPTLVATRTATKKIAPGQEVTVDAIWGRVFRGHVWELLTSAPVVNPFMKGHPIFELLERLAACVIPLNLTNPRSPDFLPENCQTLHDIARFVHEKSFHEMFGIGMLIDDFRSEAVLLDVFLPIDLYIIDLGGALDIAPGQRKVKPAKITSYPLSQVVRGMLHKEIPRFGPRAMDTKGFAELIMQQALSNPQQERTFQDPCYAIASDRYLNFTARVGYHFSALDSYCGNSATKNYVTFRFAGGAADAIRRGRRARAIAEILEASGFQIDLTADRVDAKIQKRSREEIGAALEMIGRMFQFVRQMDVAMSSDKTIAIIRDAFLSGNYRLDPHFKSRSESTQEG
jgi:pyruvate,water dikinase